MAEDGPLDPKYQLQETESSSYLQRTRQNVIDSDGTLIVNVGKLDGGTLATAKFAEEFGKAHLVLQLDSGVGDEQARQLLDWLRRESIAILNVAGPRASKRPGIYALTNELLDLAAKPAYYQPTEEKIEIGRADRPPDVGTYTPPASYRVRKRKPSKSSP